MIEALRNPPKALKAGVLRTLKGVHLAFTGILSKRRSEAVKGREARRRHRAWRHIRTHDGGCARQAQPAAGGRTRRRAQADGDQTAAGKGNANHPAE